MGSPPLIHRSELRLSLHGGENDLGELDARTIVQQQDLIE